MDEPEGGAGTLTVTRKHPLANGIVLARLEPPHGKVLPTWQPGAHIEIRLPSGLRRRYSLCGDLGDRFGYEIAVLLESDGRGGSQEFHREVQVGSELEVSVPRNQFELEASENYLFLAGGVGITPILSMIRHALAIGANWRLVYGGRSRSTMAFLETVLALDPGRVVIYAEDDNGRPDFASELQRMGAEGQIYACGPPPMLDALLAVHAAAGIVPALHLERFTIAAAADTAGAQFEVVAQRSGLTVDVGESETILGVLRPFVSHLPFSCEEGFCGTCETVVLEGTPDHRDTFLDDDERESGETMMICVSRCVGSRIVLDL